MDWRPHLIQYKSLKKSIHLVVDELESRGLSSQLLAEVVHSTTQSDTDMMKMTYVFDGDAKDPHPCIKITVHDPASLSASDNSSTHLNMLQKLIPSYAETTEPLLVKIDLVRDSEFFHLLLEELSHAATLHDLEKERFSGTVNELETAMAIAASPHKKDLYTWREIFRIYMDSSIFQNEDESKCTVPSFERSKERLLWFTQEIAKKKLEKKLTLKRSKLVLRQFLAINAHLIDFKYFQTLNQMAMTKILKKHDKRSGLSARAKFPEFVKSNTVFVQSILTSLCNAIQTKLITIVPQPEDYGCPVCLAIAWRPIRLECNHVFCVRCLVKAHRKRLFNCPICREEHAVANADARNLDQGLQNFMMLYFPREIKEKRRDNEREQAAIDAEAITGRAWTQTLNRQGNSHDNCCIM
ncbi:hypothetical protein EC973_004656 [Apophysomyces ossiformis]|uniref:SPX domain-containing protein n=1 Tax=Apophysomyces ossiformis TaxID=679940 RepID=A0A8H7BPY9_9FUNG|nr:hypothetical protein EC973_004656 [Apophysomyces ossiformis]